LSLQMPYKRTTRQQDAVDVAKAQAENILLYGGSRSGKTFIILWLMVYRALKAPGSRHVVLRKTFSAAKQAVAFDTLPKMMALAFPRVPYTINKSDWFVSFANGSELWIGGLDDKDRADKILGKEYVSMHFNECTEISYDSMTTALTRLAQNCGLKLRAFFDCNPSTKKHWSYAMFIKHIDPETNTPLDRAMYDCMLMNPIHNAENLPEGYIENRLGSLPRRKRMRFLEGKYLEDSDTALWKRSQIDRDRITKDKLPELVRIVVAIDPSCTTEGDEAGIGAAGKGVDGDYYVLDDDSLQGSPLTWARAACALYHKHKADAMVYETNQGGEMVRLTIKTADATVPCRGIHASRGKLVRAEPVATLSEQHRIHHVGVFPELEDELCNYEGYGASPNRLDWFVYAILELHQRSPQPMVCD